MASRLFFNPYVYVTITPPSNNEYPPAAMTSDTTIISGQAYGNGTYVAIGPSNGVSSGFQAFKAFDKDLNTRWNWLTYTGSGQYNGAGNSFNGTEPFSVVNSVRINGWWIQISVPSPIVLTSYSITIAGSTPTEKAPVDWTLMGSTNNGLTWDIVETRTGVTWTSVRQVQTFIVTNPAGFSTFRCAITKASANDLGIQEIRLFGTPLASPITYGWRAYVDAASSTDIGYSTATDASSNVYLIGGNGAVVANVFSSSAQSTLSVPIASAFIVQYSSTGAVNWRAYVDAASSIDVGRGVATDSSSNVYLIGGNGNAVANVFNSSAQSTLSVPIFSSFIVQYSPSGAVNWRAYVDAGSSIEVGYAVATDASNNVYLVGGNGVQIATVFDSAGVSSGLTVPISAAFIVKYSPSGAVNWRAYVDIAFGVEVGYAVATDASSNVYLIGGTGTIVANVFNSSAVSTLSVPIASAFIVQYSSTGAVNWRAYVDAASSTDVGYATATDSLNNVYLVGGNGNAVATVFNSSGASSGVTVPALSAFIVKYSPAGNVIWRAYVEGGSTEIAYGVTVDTKDNVYITGSLSTNTAVQIFNSNVYGTTTANVYLSQQSNFIVKYDSTGKYLWNSQIDSQLGASGASNEIGYALSHDSQDNVYVVGNNPLAANIYNSSGVLSTLALPASSAYIVKYNSGGEIDNQTGLRRWPPNEITYQNWTGTAPSFTYSMTNQAYGNGTYNITSTVPSAVGYDARTLFDNSAVPNLSIAYYRTATPAFVQIQFPTAVVIQLYAIIPLITGGAFTAWTFDGSNNGSTWTTLDTRTGVAMTNNGGGWWSYIFNTTAYSYYRINFTAGNGYVRNWRMYSSIYPLDSLSSDARTSMTGAYSLKRLLSSYTGAVVNIRRSADNVTSDFFADQNGNLTTGINGSGTTYTSWIGASTGFVTTWYDQSGNGRNATTDTTARQPSIDDTNKLISFTTNSGQSRLVLPNGTVPSGTSSYTVTVRHGTAVGAGSVIVPAFLGSGAAFTTGTNNVFGRVNATSGYYNYWWANDAQDTVNNFSVGNRVSFLYSTGSARQCFVNGSAISFTGGTNTRNGAIGNNFIAYGDTFNNNYLNGQLYYVAIFNTSLSNADRLIVESQ
jgi:hypothetical protein